MFFLAAAAMLSRWVDPCARDSFHIVGPVHINPVDWSLPEHRRAVAASLVRGVCVLERCGTFEDLAPMWWEFFHFQLLETLRDPDDSSIFGAIFQYKHFPQYRSQNVPRYIIAFRGTLIRRRTCTSDIKLDIRVLLHRLCVSSRYQVAIQAVENMVAKHGHSNMWLAGHSLGSAIALQVGKDMARKENFLETYLFNPPFPITPIERLRSQRLKDNLRYARSFITARLATAVKRSEPLDRADQYDTNFVKLSSWIPHLFVNPCDPLCSEYIGYFEHREKMLAMGAAPIERVASQNSLVSLVSWAIGKLVEPTHLIPSAYLAINRSSADQGTFKQAHSINQWWKPNQDLEFKLYQLS